jgi:hypothetical protein
MADSNCVMGGLAYMINKNRAARAEICPVLEVGVHYGLIPLQYYRTC